MIYDILYITQEYSRSDNGTYRPIYNNEIRKLIHENLANKLLITVRIKKTHNETDLPIRLCISSGPIIFYENRRGQIIDGIPKFSPCPIL